MLEKFGENYSESSKEKDIYDVPPTPELKSFRGIKLHMPVCIHDTVDTYTINLFT